MENNIKKSYEKIKMPEESKKKIYVQIMQSADKSTRWRRGFFYICKICVAACLAVSIIIPSSAYAIQKIVDVVSATKVSNTSHRCYNGFVLGQGSTLIFGPVEKHMPTGTSAEITMHNAISQNDIVNVYVKNKRGERVTEGDAGSFRGTASEETIYMPYYTGKGIKGEKYYLYMILAEGSASSRLLVSLYFAP